MSNSCSTSAVNLWTQKGFKGIYKLSAVRHTLTPPTSNAGISLWDTIAVKLNCVESLDPKKRFKKMYNWRNNCKIDYSNSTKSIVIYLNNNKKTIGQLNDVLFCSVTYLHMYFMVFIWEVYIINSVHSSQCFFKKI
jgi:hypothetical protein